MRFEDHSKKECQKVHVDIIKNEKLSRLQRFVMAFDNEPLHPTALLNPS